MNKNRIISIALFCVALFLAWYLGNAIYQPIKRQKEIVKIEDKVVDKLLMIQAVEKEYFATNARYAGSWKELIDFVDTGISYVVKTTEIPFIRPIEERWKGDSSTIILDTLSSTPVKEKLFPKDKYPDFDSKKLPLVPNKDYTFKIFAGEITMGGVPVKVVHVMDPKPEDPSRKEDHDFRDRRNLQFGDPYKVTIEGNWVRTDAK